MEPHPTCVAAAPNTTTILFNDVFLNLSGIARLRGMAPAQVSRIFSGAREPTLPQARKIASALGMTLDDFLAARDRHLGRITEQVA